jgi:pimeloyl-ACP methyl ester carboxylesterase
MKLSVVCLGFQTLLFAIAAPVQSDEAADQDPLVSQDPQPPPFNLTTPTLGGSQLWTDQLIFRDWRIQKNAITGHYRLLDDEDLRRAWGTFDECRDRLDELREKLPLEPIRGEVVLVLHGLGRTRDSMAGMCRYLEREGRYTVLNMSYATTRGRIEDHAAALARVVRNLDPGVTEVNFVAHSLGNIVVRRFLYDYERQSEPNPIRPRVKRIVMLGPPNRGSQLAQRFPHSMLVRLVAGSSTVELAKNWTSLQQRLATPRCQFGIIAGGQGDDDGRNGLLEGDDDLIVTVEETKLAGARDFAVLPVYHGVIMLDRRVREYTLRFLQHGYFRSDADRQPIAAEQTVGDHDG